jgi:hypothetical protein
LFVGTDGREGVNRGAISIAAARSSDINAPAGTFAEAVVDELAESAAMADGPGGRDVGIGTAAGGGFLAWEAAKCEKRCPGAVGDVAVVDRATAGEAGDWLTPLGN